jgi:hypothetical protein
MNDTPEFNRAKQLSIVLAEIDRLRASKIHSCHSECARPNCVLRRELTAVTAQRDRLAEAAQNLCMALIAKEPIDIIELMNAVGEALQSSKQFSPDPR